MFYFLSPKHKLHSSLSSLLLPWFKFLSSLAWSAAIAYQVSLPTTDPKLWPPECPFSHTDLTMHPSLKLHPTYILTGMPNVQPMGHRQHRMAMNVAQHEVINLLKTLWDVFVYVIMCHNVFNVWPKTTLLPEMPKVWTPLHRGYKSLTWSA